MWFRYLPHQVFRGVLENHPQDVLRLRKETIRMAFIRGLIAYTRKIRVADQRMKGSRKSAWAAWIRIDASRGYIDSMRFSASSSSVRTSGA